MEVRHTDLGDIAGHVVRSSEESLKRLGMDYLDILQIHNGAQPHPLRSLKADRTPSSGSKITYGPAGRWRACRGVREGKTRYLFLSAAGTMRTRSGSWLTRTCFS